MTSIWITWERQRRNRSMAALTGATLHELEYNGSRLVRMLLLTVRTIRIIRNTKPDVVFFQNPSLVLATLIATLKALSIIRCKTVGDFHNAGVFPPVAAFLTKWIVRNTDLVIVSNQNLQVEIDRLGGRSLAMADPIPEMHGTKPVGAPASDFNVLFICSWAADEPIVEVLKAGGLLASSSDELRISITGRAKLEKIGWTGPVPPSIELTGFLPEAEFETRLAQCALVLDLTTRADCMVCGAYEAVSAEVPMILSDNAPTRAYFDEGALFTDNSAGNIAALVQEARARHAELKANVVRLKQRLLTAERVKLRQLQDIVAS